MKYLLVGHYAGFDLDDPEDYVNTAFTLGIYNTKEEVISAVNKEFVDYINEQVNNRFDVEYEEMTDEEKEEADFFRKRYEVSVYENFEPKLNETVEVGNLHLDAEFYFEDEKVEVIMLED